MSAGRIVLYGTTIVIALAVAIVFVWLPRSTPLSEMGDGAPRPSAELLPFTWHQTPRDIPHVTFLAKDGAPVPIEKFRGRTRLVNLWATWCAPCLREMPMLDTLANATAGPKFEIIALNQDRGGLEAALPIWEEHAFTGLKLYLDDGLKTGRKLEARGLPLTVLIDAEGRELGRLEGIATWDAPEVIAYFRTFAN